MIIKLLLRIKNKFDILYLDKLSANLRFGYEELNSMANGDYKLLENQNPNKDSSQTSLKMKEKMKIL